jgi:hypothetical protein
MRKQFLHEKDSDSVRVATAKEEVDSHAHMKRF